jgi:hypothetical protein
MARQPFPRHLHDENCSIGTKSLEQRPKHASLVGLCLGLWPEVDMQMAILLAVLLKADKAGTIAVYLTLRRSSSRFEAIEAAAQGGLNDRESELLKAVLRFVKSVESERNVLAHSLFAICDKLPESLLVLDQTTFARFFVNNYSSNNVRSFYHTSETRIVTENLFHYTESDLYSILNDIKSVQKVLLKLNTFLMQLDRTPRPPICDSLYDELTRQPRIEEGLSYLREAAQRKQSTPSP